MTYAPPTPQDIKARFPEFEAVADTAIAYALEVATLSVDASWLDADRYVALCYLTGHLLVVGGTMALDPIAHAANGPVVTESLGDASWSFQTRAAVVGLTGMGAELATTSYGQRFLLLRGSNHPAVALC